MSRELSTQMRVTTEEEIDFGTCRVTTEWEIDFRETLLMKCQREFEAERLYDDNRDEKLTEIENAESVCTSSPFASMSRKTLL
jgi:hypothetical protein